MCQVYGVRGLCLLMMLLLGGCAATLVSDNPAFTTEEVGPIWTRPSEGPPGTGALEVFTATKRVPDRSGYIVASPQNFLMRAPGGQWKTVRNQDYLNPVAEPRPIELPPGEYEIEAPADTYRVARVRIRIEAGQTTVVNLVDQTFPTSRPANRNRAVFSPEGYMVGWRD